MMSNKTGRRLSLLASVGLACMFGGIWLGDFQMFQLITIEQSTLAMRIISAAVYVVFFAVVFTATSKARVSTSRFFGGFILVSLVLLALGMGMAYAASTNAQDALIGSFGFSLVALMLTKIIGAPVSVLLVCSFSLLPRSKVIRASVGGMIGAFLLFTLLKMALNLEGFDPSLTLVASFVLLLFAGAAGMAGLRSPSATGTWNFGEGESVASRDYFAFDSTGRLYSRTSRLSIQAGVVKRPLWKILTPGYLLIVVFSALMLGYLRNGYQTIDPHSNGVAIVALVVLILVALLWNGLATEHIFYTALLCVCCSVLLGWVFADLPVNIADVLLAVGAGLFEVVMWLLAVWAARNSTQVALAATGVRLLTVLGHLLGTTTVAVVASIIPDWSLAVENAGLLIVFVYIIMLVILLRVPGIQAPFMPVLPDSNHGSLYQGVLSHASVEDETSSAIDFDEENQASSSETAAFATTKNTSEESVSQAGLDQRYWEDPCDVISLTYGLTAREREVLGLLARGRDMAFMEEDLVISRNTLKMHIRHIYTKLDVHSKQDVIDMVDQMRV